MLASECALADDRDHAHAAPLKLLRHLDRHDVAAAGGDHERGILRREVEVPQDARSKAAHVLEEHRLPLPIRADDEIVEAERQLDDRIEPRERAVARPHLLDHDAAVAGAEDVHHASGEDRLGEPVGGRADLRELRSTASTRARQRVRYSSATDMSQRRMTQRRGRRKLECRSRSTRCEHRFARRADRTGPFAQLRREDLALMSGGTPFHGVELPPQRLEKRGAGLRDSAADDHRFRIQTLISDTIPQASARTERSHSSLRESASPSA